MESDNPIVNGDGPLDGKTPEDRNSRLDILSVLPILIGLSWLRGPLFCCLNKNVTNCKLYFNTIEWIIIKHKYKLVIVKLNE